MAKQNFKTMMEDSYEACLYSFVQTSQGAWQETTLK